MAIYNIALSSGYSTSSASWVNNDADTRAKPSQFIGGVECDTNVAFLPSGVCVQSLGDRFAISSKLRSGSLSTVRSNSNEINSGDPTLSIRIIEDNSAMRANYYNEIYGTFVSGFPNSNLYYLPQQVVSSVFLAGSNFYGKINPTRIVSQVEREQFLPANYKDKFANKDNVYIAVSGDIDNAMSFQLNTLVFSLFPDSPGRFDCYFIKPTGNNANFNSDTFYPYYTYGNVGIGLDSIKLSFTDSTKILNVVNSGGEIVIGLVYDGAYVGSEVAVKHPVINNYLLLTLSSGDLTTINLEDYQ